ncbi:hypothetical protein WSM22_06980 [Cytophagales bacterium WSM2-2]|nr:hypothetical protein WSM22_06980 [Cytophagales bacterium WSM2-2]
MDACKNKLLLVLVWLTISYTPVWGQEKKIALSGEPLRLDVLLKTITQQTGFIFSYNTRKVNQSLIFDLSQKKYSLEELLLKVKEKTGLEYSIAENHIILKTPRPIVQPVPSFTSSQVPESEKQSNLVKANKKIEPKPKTDSVTRTARPKEPQQIVETKSSSDSSNQKTETERKGQVIRSKPVETPSVISSLPVAKDQASNPVKKDSSTQKTDNKDQITKREPKRVREKIDQAPMLRIGISGDETLYTGPAVQLGIPALYATASYKTDLTLGLFSYGVGTTFRVGNARFQLFVNRGTISKQYDSLVFSVMDSSQLLQVSHRTIKAESNLTRAGITFEKPLTSKLTLEAGFQYNFLSTAYSSKGFVSPVTDADGLVQTIVPPYTIENTYKSSTSSHIKTWVGIQISLFYTINFKVRR